MGQTACSSSSISLALSRGRPTPQAQVSASRSVMMKSFPRKRPESMGPPGTMMAGRSSRAAARRCPGTFLSQLLIRTNPSKLWIWAQVSTSAAMTSRVGVSYRMPPDPTSTGHWANPPNSTGVPPACQIPAFTASVTALRWMCPGLVSLQVLWTPMRGQPQILGVVPHGFDQSAHTVHPGTVELLGHRQVGHRASGGYQVMVQGYRLAAKIVVPRNAAPPHRSTENRSTL